MSGSFVLADQAFGNIETNGEAGDHMMERVRSFFSSAVPDVELHLHGHPAAPEALGAVFGKHLYLNVESGRIPAEEIPFVVGHELAHVLQQREGRVQPTGWKDGIPFNDDALLEVEADAMGTCFALGVNGFSGVRAAIPRAWPAGTALQPTLQCLLTMGSKRVNSSADLSPKGQTLLTLIPHGSEWLKGIAGSDSRYDFSNELDLLTGIHVGLHGSDTLLLRRLGVLAHLERLHDLEQDELEGILSVERSPAENVVNLRKTKKALARHGLWSESELSIADEFLRTTGVAAEPVFRSLSLSDRVSLFELVNEANTAQALNPMLQREAATFAVSRAQNAAEFIDYYQFYMAQIHEANPQPQLAGKRMRFAEALAETLSELMFDHLWSPNFPGPPEADELPIALRQWSVQGKRVGFPRLSAALAHVAQFGELHGASGPAARQLIDAYMERANGHWIQRTPSAVQLSQDGHHRDYIYDLPNVQAVLRLASDGSLTIGAVRSTSTSSARGTQPASGPSAARLREAK